MLTEAYCNRSLFFEPSTRTRASFELAARRLAADVLSLDVRTSSRAKGESIIDTIYTLEAMQADGVVVEACIACARKLELVEGLKALDIDVKGMGVPLSEALKDPETEVLTF